MSEPLDAVKELFDLLDKAGIEWTFSLNCRSGLIGREKCQCWRCRQDRGVPVTAETEVEAAEMAVTLDTVFRVEHKS